MFVCYLTAAVILTNKTQINLFHLEALMQLSVDKVNNKDNVIVLMKVFGHQRYMEKDELLHNYVFRQYLR